jgi:hypothetical protein
MADFQRTQEIEIPMDGSEAYHLNTSGKNSRFVLI